MSWIHKSLIKIAFAQDGGEGINPSSGVTPSGGTNPSGGVTPSGGQVPGSGLKLLNPLGERSTIFTILDNILSFLMKLGAVVLPIIIVYAAFQMLTSGGDPEKFLTGRKTILYAVIGFAIILVSRGLVYVIANVLNVQVPLP